MKKIIKPRLLRLILTGLFKRIVKEDLLLIVNQGQEILQKREDQQVVS